MSTSKHSFFEELRVNKLPTLPHVLNDILTACQSPTAGMDTLGEIIRHDATLTSKLIALANSASYFQRQKVNNINRALLLIGTEQTKTIAITAAVQQFFSAFSAQQTEYLKNFWTVSLSCALLAKAFANLTQFPRPEEAYLTGLLHNIGELALRTNFPNEYNTIDKNEPIEAESEPRSLTDREEEALQANHCEFGAWLSEQWGLSEFASAAIKHHHESLPLLVDAHHLVKIVYVASHLGDTDEQTRQAGMEAAGQLFNLTAEVVREMCQKTREDVLNVATSLQIELISDQDDTARIQQQDEKEQLRLARQVRNLSLLSTAKEHINESTSISEICRAIEDSAYMLFGFSSVRLFVIEEHLQILRYLNFPAAVAESNDSDIQLEIPIQQVRNMMSAAIISEKVITSRQWEASKGKLPVIDQHVLALLKTRHMVCVPFYSLQPNREQATRPVGLMALGTHRPPKSTAQTVNMLRMFANHAGERFYLAQQSLRDGNQQLSREEQQLKLRKITHEISNPLTIITNYLGILSDRLVKENQAQKDISIIREEINRVGDILIKLTDDNSANKQSAGTDINREIQDLVSLFSASLFLTQEIHCHVDLDDRLKPQAITRSYIKQILINLLKNAAEAMPEGGEIFISSNHQVNVNSKHYTEIIIRDTGRGLDEALLPHLFEPSGLSRANQHPGLGLSITKTLVDELQGTISCRNTKGGAQFQILLPAKDLKLAYSEQTDSSD